MEVAEMTSLITTLISSFGLPGCCLIMMLFVYNDWKKLVNDNKEAAQKLLKYLKKLNKEKSDDNEEDD